MPLPEEPRVSAQNDDPNLLPRPTRPLVDIKDTPAGNFLSLKKKIVNFFDAFLGLTLSWNMFGEYEPISRYEIYTSSFIEAENVPLNAWDYIGEVYAMPLPIACILKNFIRGHRYVFSIRAVDIHQRYGPFSLPGTLIRNS